MLSREWRIPAAGANISRKAMPAYICFLCIESRDGLYGRSCTCSIWRRIKFVTRFRSSVSTFPGFISKPETDRGGWRSGGGRAAIPEGLTPSRCFSSLYTYMQIAICIGLYGRWNIGDKKKRKIGSDTSRKRQLANQTFHCCIEKINVALQGNQISVDSRLKKSCCVFLPWFTTKFKFLIESYARLLHGANKQSLKCNENRSKSLKK